MTSSPDTAGAELHEAGRPHPRGEVDRTRWWALLLVALALAVSGSLVAAAERGPTPPPLRDGVAGLLPVRPAAARGLPPGAVALGGSGSNLPLVRLLVEAFVAARPGPPLHIFPSIGSGGGLRALRDGVLDAALVSRPVSAAEGDGLRVFPLARVPVVLATSSREAARAGLSTEALLALYAGERGRFADGTQARIVQRERGDSAHRAVAEALPGFLEVDQVSRRAARFPIARSDAEMARTLIASPHAAGLFDVGLIRVQALPLFAVVIDGVVPDAASVRSGRYPFHRDLRLVTRAEPPGRLAAFLRFASSPEASALCARHGYMPLAAGDLP